MKHHSRIYDSMRQCAAAEGWPLKILKWAKANGCPGFKNGRVYGAVVQKWLAAHPQPKPGRKASTAAPAPSGTGEAASMVRLSQAEAEAHGEWQAAKQSGDPDEEGRARKAWLEISEARRRAYLALEEHKRDAGELIERKEVERALWAFGYWTNALWMTCRLQAGVELQRLAQLPTNAMFEILDRHLRFGVLVGAAAGMGAGSAPEIPAWIRQRMIEFWAHNTYPDMHGRINEVVKILRGVIAQTATAPAAAEPTSPTTISTPNVGVE